MSVKLTSEEFWDNFWKELKLPVKVNFNFKNDRVIANSLLDSVKARAIGQSSIEIGCAPGKWMIFASEHLGYHSYGLEYLQSAAEATKKNLKECGIRAEVLNADFFDFETLQKFDLVMSFGFIEHFKNYEEVFKRHLDLVSPGGFLVLGLPRFRGVNYPLQRCIDLYLDKPYLQSHVLDVMMLAPFLDLADKFNLDKICAEYVGGFEPSLFPIGEVKNNLIKILLRIYTKTCSIIFGKINSPMTSSYQLIVFRKPLHIFPG